MDGREINSLVTRNISRRTHPCFSSEVGALFDKEVAREKRRRRGSVRNSNASFIRFDSLDSLDPSSRSLRRRCSRSSSKSLTSTSSVRSPSSSAPNAGDFLPEILLSSDPLAEAFVVESWKGKEGAE